jgi:hypothetical protein
LRKAATSARKHGFGEEQWEADHVSETATRAIMTVAVLIAGSGLMLHMGHAQQSGTKRDLQSFR